MSVSEKVVSIRPPKLEGDDELQSNPYLPLLDKQRNAFIEHGFPTAEERVAHLDTLARAVSAYADRLTEAVSADFGHRSEVETLATDVLAVLGEIKFTRGKIKKWMKAKKPPFASGLPGIKLVYQPKGVVGVMGAWNYPTMLVLSPAIGAIAAGNRVMLKPPDVTPRTAEVIAEMVAEYFSEEVMSVVTGGVESSIQFSELPFDHLIYTGNTEIGRRVMMAAAKNLTPVTLEMGGKSPTIVADNFPVRTAIDRIMMGKSFNAGQTCVAPDYVLLKKGREEEFVREFEDAAQKRFPTLADNEDITWIVNDRHFARVNALIEDAREKGAKVLQVNPAKEVIPDGKRIIPLTVITDVTDDMRIMQEEIFGPVLPIKSVTSTDEALEYVKRRARPLALYYFDDDKSRAEKVMDECIAGGACANDVMLHGANMHMPFGGTGDSGVGAYHGFYGFAEFSHKKSVMVKSADAFSPTPFLSKPYGQSAPKWMRRIIKFLTPKG